MQVGPKVKLGLAKSRVVRDEAGVTANYKIRPRLYFASSVFWIGLYFAPNVFCIVLNILLYRICIALYFASGTSPQAGFSISETQTQGHFWF